MIRQKTAAKVLYALVIFFQWQPVDASASEEIALALVADPHVTLSTDGEKASYGPHFEEAIRQINAAGVALVLIAGDLANEGRKEEWTEFNRLIKKFSAPVLFIPGNHDVGPKPNSGKESAVTSKRYGRYTAALGEGFWVKDLAGVRIIGITGSLLGTGLPEEASQWEMLEKSLASPSPLPTILLTHYPLFLKSPNELGGGYWNVEVEPRQRLFSLIKSGGVCAVLTGHLHRSFLLKHDGVLYAGAPAVSFGLPRGKEPAGWGLVTVEKQGDLRVEWKHLQN